MTKKELLESEVFQALPDDAEIVFATHEKTHLCTRLNALNLSAVKECTNIPEHGGELFEPKYFTALVIDAIPYWLLKEKYGISLSM